jgi:hypothetical protein
MPLARAFGVHEGLFVYEHAAKDADRPSATTTPIGCVSPGNTIFDGPENGGSGAA